MYRVCYEKATNKIIEMQSGGKADRLPADHEIFKDEFAKAKNLELAMGKTEQEAEEIGKVAMESSYQLATSEWDKLEAMRLNTLRENAINAGYQEADIEVSWMTEAEYHAQIKAGLTLDEIKALKNAECNAIREAKIAEGIPYKFHDGDGIVQTRSLVDIRNITTNVLTALILKNRGITDPVLVFRDMGDAEHQMTPDQMLDMGLFVGQYGQAIFKQSWDLKKDAKNMTIEQIKDFDVKENWPK